MNHEQMLLGSCLVYPEAAVDAWVSEVRAEHFTDPRHRQIWLVIEDQIANNKSLDMSRLMSVVPGQAAYLGTLMNDAPSPSSVKDFAESVKDKARDRAIKEAAMKALAAIARKEIDSPFGNAKTTNDALEPLINLIYKSDASEKPVTPREAFEEMARVWNEQAKNNYKDTVVPTGIKSVDTLLNGGIGRGSLLTIAAGTGFGKSIIAVNIASAAVRAGYKVLYVSIEMGIFETYCRLLSSEQQAEFHKVYRGPRGQSEVDAFDQAYGQFVNSDLHVLCTTNRKIHEIERLIRFEKIRRPYDLLVLDYIQQFEYSERLTRQYEQISKVSSFLKIDIAKKHNLAVLSMAQMNRNAEAEGQAGFRLGNIAEAAAIERDSDSVAILIRENNEQPSEKALNSGYPTENLAWLKFSKQRHGKNNVTLPLRFNGKYVRFEDFTDEEHRQADFDRKLLAPVPAQPKKKTSKIKMTEGERIVQTRRYGDSEEF